MIHLRVQYHSVVGFKNKEFEWKISTIFIFYCLAKYQRLVESCTLQEDFAICYLPTFVFYICSQICLVQ